MSDLVSICIPAWERPDLLLKTVESCLAQTYANIEVVIADDSRTDAVRRAMAPLLSHGRIRFVHNEQRLAQSGNVNRLFELARGERLILLHDDDILLPDAVEVLDRVWRDNPGLIACYGKHYVVTHGGSVLTEITQSTNDGCRRTPQHAGVQSDSLWSVLTGQFPPDAFMVLTAAARATGFRSEHQVGDACDFDFRLRLARLPGRFYCIDRFVSKYRVTDTSISSRPGPLDHAFVLALNLELPRELEATRQHFLRLRAPYATRRYILGGQRRLAWELMLQTHYWSDGRLSRAFLSNVVLMLLPRRLALVLRYAKHAARAKLRRHDALYLRVLSVRARLASALSGHAQPRVKPGVPEELRPGDRAAL